MDKGRPEKESDAARRSGNLVLLVFFVIIVAIGVWLVNAMVDARRIDDCISQNLRNCNPIEVPPPQR
jgi:cytoskeletal protein RodZ